MCRLTQLSIGLVRCTYTSFDLTTNADRPPFTRTCTQEEEEEEEEEENDEL